MREYVSVLKNTVLFRGIEEDDLITMLPCLDASIKTCQKGEYLLHQGDTPKHIMVLLSGEIHIRCDDFWGKCTILSHVSKGDMLGEAYVSPDSGPFPNDAVAVSDSTVMCFDARRLITTCSSACRFHTAVVQNLFFAISEKNRSLVRKIYHMSRRTTREKLMSYLSDEAKKRRSSSFTIPFNRQELADFLSVDRSAMSSELCKMRDEGLLEFDRSRFRLL